MIATSEWLVTKLCLPHAGSIVNAFLDNTAAPTVRHSECDYLTNSNDSLRCHHCSKYRKILHSMASRDKHSGKLSSLDNHHSKTTPSSHVNFRYFRYSRGRQWARCGCGEHRCDHTHYRTISVKKRVDIWGNGWSWRSRVIVLTLNILPPWLYKLSI